MFNAGYKKETIAVLEDVVSKYNRTHSSTMEDIISLHNKRTIAVEQIKRVENFINSLANTPKEFAKPLSDIQVNRHKFQTEIEQLEFESKKANKASGGLAGAGVAAGVGVAAFGPTAAMAVATTFGTASTGTAIATLSGAAATKAALAWLGGGALIAGGGGMAAGNALLALAGPVGWAIGGTALVGGGLLANNKNKKIAEKAEVQAKTVKGETNELLKLKSKVQSISTQTSQMSEKMSSLLKQIISSGVTDYNKCNEEQRNQLSILINVTMSLSSKVCEKVS